jgi:hypothetical protein
MTGLRAFVTRTVRAVKIVVRDGRIPRPIRWGGALGLAPIPGPIDEVVLLVVGGILWVFYRDQLREAWRRTAAARSRSPALNPGAPNP